MKTINIFMLDVTAELLNCYIEENNLNEWEVVTVNSGLKLLNKTTQQHTTWNIYNYDEDYEAIKNAIIKFLKLQTITK